MPYGQQYTNTPAPKTFTVDVPVALAHGDFADAERHNDPSTPGAKPEGLSFQPDPSK